MVADMTMVRDIHIRDTRANQASYVQVDIGSLYYVTDEAVTERWSGSAWEDVSDGGISSGVVVQVKNFQTGASVTGTTTIPVDDTIPQNTEGFEAMTLSITPTSATNKLKIEVVVNAGSSATPPFYIAAALFQDSAANALAVQASTLGTSTHSTELSFTHYMDAGTTSATTFKVRVGANGAGTHFINGINATRLYGGVMASSITITEIVP